MVHSYHVWKIFCWRRKRQHISSLAWRIPWTEEPGELSFIGLQSQTRVSTHAHMGWRGEGEWFRDDSSTLHLLCTLFLLLLYQLHLRSSGIRSWRLGTPNLSHPSGLTHKFAHTITLFKGPAVSPPPHYPTFPFLIPSYSPFPSTTTPPHTLPRPNWGEKQDNPLLVLTPSCCSIGPSKALSVIFLWPLINFYWLKIPRTGVSNTGSLYY